MPRKSRRLLWSEDACFHIFNRGHNRETVFHHDDDRRFFLDLCKRYCDRFALNVYHYCLMDNHFHLLTQLHDARQLSSMVAGLLRSYVHYFNRRYGFVGHLWQGRFKSPAVQKETYLLSCGRYIERNPLAAGIVGEPWEYEWSSCPAYTLGEADPLLAENAYYLELGQRPSRRQRRWREFLLGEDDKEPTIDLDADTMGAADFRHRIEQARGRTRSRGAGRPMRAGDA